MTYLCIFGSSLGQGRGAPHYAADAPGSLNEMANYLAINIPKTLKAHISYYIPRLRPHYITPDRGVINWDDVTPTGSK